MPSPRRSRSRESHGSARSKSTRSSRIPSHRVAAQQTSDTEHPSPKRNSSTRRPTVSPPRPVSPRPHSQSPSPSRTANRKRFGLNVPNIVPKVPGKFDFEDKYPEDPIYEEMGPNARLWRAFLDEMEAFNIDMVTESRDGLDLLLVFAGLFSAVLTTFVAQTSQALSANFSVVSSSLLVEMVALQRAQINNAPINDILPADTTTGPSGFDVWVNALWFTSLTLSLGTALMAVLVKQWLYQYMVMISGTARDRSLIQFYRFEGLQKWHVLTIIGTLPIVLHIALGLFLAGLVIFLIPLNVPLASVVGVMTLIVYILYAVSNILPIIYTQCPYRTPFSDILSILLRSIRTFPLLMMGHIHKCLHAFGLVATSNPKDNEYKRTTLKETERLAATNDDIAEEVAWRALLWLYQMTSNPPTRRIIQESLGCLSDDVSKRSKELHADLGQTLNEISPSTFDYGRKKWYRLIPTGQERRAERILRSVRDPLAPTIREGLKIPAASAPWRLDITDSELSFQLLTAILVHAPNISVETEAGFWKFPSLLKYLIKQQFSLHAPIRLPPQLWTVLIPSASPKHEPWLHVYDNLFLGELCMHAVKNFDGGEQPANPPPFAGPVTVTHRTVPALSLIVDLLVHRLGTPHAPDPFEYEPLRQLFIIYDYAATASGNDFNATATENLHVLLDTWAALSRIKGLCENDKKILCWRAENAFLRMEPNDSWWDSQDEERHCVCYSNVLAAYNQHDLADLHPISAKFFKKLLSDLCSSLGRDSPDFIRRISTTLKNLMDQNANEPVYQSLLCTSPFLSIPTMTSLANCTQSLYPLVSTLVDNMPHGIDQHKGYTESLYADPHRLFTLYRIIMMGPHANMRLEDPADHVKQRLLNLARMNPTHDIWTNRAHYVDMEPQTWPYLHFSDEELRNEAFIVWIKKSMRIGLSFLDEYFVSLKTSSPNDSTALDSAPPQNITVPQVVPLSNPRWSIRQFLPGTAALLGVSHGPTLEVADDIELGLQASRGLPVNFESDIE